MLNTIRSLNKYRDGWGLITQADRDGGDTASRTGAYYTIIGALNAKDDRGADPVSGATLDLLQLSSSPGRYVRHPGGTKQGNGRYNRWFANPDNFTRDQSINLQSAMVVCGLEQELSELVKVRKTRYFRHFNTESYDDSEPTKITTPDLPQIREFGQFIRGLRLGYLYPVLVLLDVELLVASLVNYFAPVTKSSGDSAQKLLCVLLASKTRYQTPFSILARKIMKKSNAEQKINLYFSQENGENGIVPLGDLLSKAVTELL